MLSVETRARKQLPTTLAVSKKTGCGTCHNDCFLSTLLLTLSSPSLFTQSRIVGMKGFKACQHTNLKTHTFAFCCDLNRSIVRLFWRNNKTSLPLSAKPQHPALNSPSFFPFTSLSSSIGFLQAICSGAKGPLPPQSSSTHPMTWHSSQAALGWLPRRLCV